jgi:hypothetical protein
MAVDLFHSAHARAVPREELVNDKAYAFPSPSHAFHQGLTKREWFAGQALAGLAANKASFSNPRELVLTAYQLADMMLAEGE